MPFTTEPKRRRHGRLRCVGEVRLAFDQVTVNLGLKRGLHLRGRSTDGDRVSPARHGNHLQALFLKPLCDFAEIDVAHAEALPILFRRQPVVIIRRAGRLLVYQEFFEFGLLARRWRKRQSDVRDRH